MNENLKDTLEELKNLSGEIRNCFDSYIRLGLKKEAVLQF